MSRSVNDALHWSGQEVLLSKALIEKSRELLQESRRRLIISRDRLESPPQLRGAAALELARG